MDKPLRQDEIIVLPEALRAATLGLSASPRCDSKQTDCANCLSTSGQCLAACERSAQCSTACERSVQCGSCEDGCLSHECGSTLCGSCQEENQGCGSCETCQGGCLGACEVACQGCQICQDFCEIYAQNPSTGATLSLLGGNGTLTWTISGLSAPFNTSNYISAGITIYQFTVGGVSSISGIESSKAALSSGSATSVSLTLDYEPGTYTFWGFAQTPSGGNPKYWPAGSATVTVLPKYETFNWDYAGRDPVTNARIVGATKRNGLVACITADEWNRLVDAVNQRKGTSIPHVSQGMVANSVAVVKPVASALGISIPSGFSADFFNQLRIFANQL